MHDGQVFMPNAFLVAQHFGSSRGLLGKMFDFILVLKLFLKGNVEARLAIGLLLRNNDFFLFFATSIFASPLAF